MHSATMGEAIPFPEGSYSVIYADPPWSYANWTDAKNGAACSAYDTMSNEDICSLPVADLAADDCVLLMWGTWPKLVEGLEVIKRWGFEFVTCAFVWNKVNRDGTPYMGLGFYTRSGSEFVLLGKRGSVPVAVKDVFQVQTEPMDGKHSQKPAIFIERIDRLWPEGKRIELFARRRWPGWDAWGNQVEDAMPLFSEELG